MNPMGANPVTAIMAARESAQAEAIEAGRRRRRRRRASAEPRGSRLPGS